MYESNDSGVDNVPAAGEPQDQQEEQGQDNFDDYETLLTADEDPEETGVEEAGAADQQDQGADEGESDDAFSDPKVSEAFAKRLSQMKEQIEADLRAELQQQYQPQQPQANQQQQYQQQQQQYQPQNFDIPPLPKEQMEELADQLALTPEAVQVLYSQQYLLHKQNEYINNLAGTFNNMRENDSKSQTKAQVEQMRAKNPNLPGFDENKVAQIRQEHYQQYGVPLTWDAAYKQLVASEAMSGNLFRQAEQNTIKNINRRSKKNLQAGRSGQQANTPSLDDVPDSVLEKMIEKAKSGAYMKSTKPSY